MRPNASEGTGGSHHDEKRGLNLHVCRKFRVFAAKAKI